MHPGIDLVVATCCYICQVLLSSSKFLGLLHPELKQDVLACVYHPVTWEIKAGRSIVEQGVTTCASHLFSTNQWKNPNERVSEKNNFLSPFCSQWNPVLLPSLAVVTNAQTLHCRLSTCLRHSATKSWDTTVVIKLADHNLCQVKEKQTKIMI